MEEVQRDDGNGCAYRYWLELALPGLLLKLDEAICRLENISFERKSEGYANPRQKEVPIESSKAYPE